MTKNKIDDGGPAFPVEVTRDLNGELVGAQTGIDTGWATGLSLRDYFAGQVISVLISNFTDPIASGTRSCIPRACAKAYEFADAMLAARKLNETLS